MQSAPLPENEIERLAALRASGLLDSAAEQEFDELVELAAQICGTPISLVSLVDRDRQWFKARLGLDASETPREVAFCSHAILSDEVFVVENAAEDNRFSDNPLVTGEPHIRFYAGAQLHDPAGLSLGTLCVIDREPRKLSPQQKHALQVLARQVSRIIALRIKDQTIYTAEMRERERQRLYESFYAVLGEGIVYHKADGAIDYFNQSALDILGLTEDQLLGRSSFHPEWRTIREDGEAFAPETHPAVRSLQKGETCRGVIMGVYKPRGRLSWIAINSVPLKDMEGRITGACVSFFDITKQKEHESELREARDAARAADRAKSEFLAVMSHEIRTPMNGVIGMASLLATTPLEPDQQRYVDVIQESGRRLIRVINDILDYTKMEAGKLDLIEETFSPAGLLSSAAELLEPEIRRKGLDFRTVITLPEDLLISGDSDRLRQIALNLLNNAWKFTHEGRIGLTAELTADNFLEVTVADTGIGIPADKLAILFQPFTQADATTSRQYGGSGLGLAICERLVRIMGGSIAVQSEPGRGTRISFRIPVKVVSAGSGQKSGSLAAVQQGLRILVAEDDPISQELLLAMLRRFEARPSLAEDGFTAIQLSEAATYDAAIIDLHMPGMDGTHVMRALRKKQPGLYIIAATAATSEKDRLTCEKAGCNAFLEKPYDIRGLALALSGAAHA